ncbi:MAG: AsmA-like C-terminal domain-containing protein [Rhizomicrobium sp.]
MTQDRPVSADRAAVRTTLAEAWNASFVGRYVKSHHISRTALIVSALGVAVLFFAVGAALRLLVGPISLGPLSGQISDALAQALPGITVKYDQAAVEWSRDQGRVNLVVLGARVFDSKGRIIAQAPQADIDLAAQPFLRGDVVVTRITLVGVQLTMVRNADGTLRLGVEHDDSQKDIISRITDAINKSSSSASSLEAFAVRDARVAFLDETTGLFLVAPKADVRIANSGPDLVASIEADIEVSGRAAHIAGELRLPPRTGPVKGHIEVHHLDVAALGRNAKMFAFLQSVAMTADFSSDFAVSGSHLLNADFSLDGAGTAALVGLRNPVRVSSLHLSGRYDRTTARLTLADASLVSDRLRAHVVGGMDLVYDPSGAIARLGVDLTADKTALQVPGTFAQPVFVPLAQFKGSYVPATHDILIDRLSTTGGALVLAASGRITLVDKQSPVMDLTGRIEPLAIRDMLHYWPLDIGGGARDWIASNIFAGTLGPVVFETHLPAGALDLPVVPDGALLMTFPITNAELSYMEGLTHMTGVTANAKLTGNSFGADILRARIGPLVLSKGRAVIPDLSAPSSPGDIAAHIDGSMTDLLKLTDLKPLNYATRFGIDPNATAGKAAIDLTVHLPMRKNLSIDDIAIAIKAVSTGFGISLGKNTRLSDGAVTFDVDNTHLHAYGSTNLATSRLAIDWVEDFKSTGAVTTVVGIKGPLDQAGREALGFHATDYLKGPIGVSGTLTGKRGQLIAGDLALDLTPATLSLDLVGISKPMGFPASAHALLTFGPGSLLRGANVTIAGPSLQAAMTAVFDDNGRLVSLNAPSVKSGAANDFAFSLTRNAAGVDIAVHGRSLDGTQIARRGSSSGAGAKDAAAASNATFAEPFHINAKLDRLALRNGIAIAPFALDVSGTAERPAAMTLSGRLGKTGTLSGSIAPAGNDRRLTLQTNDFGTLAHGLFGFASIKGGKLDLQATLHGPAAAPPTTVVDPANDYEGTVRLKDFRLLNQPFLARLFSAGSLVGFGNLMQGGGIEVDDLKVPFTAKNGVLGILNARASGPAIGVSAEGYIDRPKNEIALKGTLVPLFGINSALGYIPLLGDILVSKPGEGIIGMVYSVEGNADEPQVSINPLSMVTPGFFRRIFEGNMPSAANAPSNAAPAAPTNAPKP